MSDVFTPLTPAALASCAAASAAGSFKPLPSPGSAPAAPVTASGCAAKPTVTLQRKGNVVTSIRVQCSCGQVLDINCQY